MQMDPSQTKHLELRGHSRVVSSVAFSTSGQLLASASFDRTIRVWNPQSGEQVAILIGHTNRVRSVAFLPDSTILASASDDKTIKLWDVASQTQINTLTAHSSPVRFLAFSADGTLLASASEDSTVKLWEVKSNSCINTMKGHSGEVYCVAFSPNKQTIASGSGDKEVRLWSVEGGEYLAALIGHNGTVFSVAFSPDGRQLASGSHDQSVILWDTATRLPVARLEAHTDRVYSVAFSPLGRYLASGSEDGSIQLWDMATRSHQSQLSKNLGAVNCVAFRPGGYQIASASSNSTVKLWKLPIANTASAEKITEGRDEHEALETSTFENLKNDITPDISLAGSFRIGLGGFGGVFLGTHKHRGKVALKRPHKMFDETSARRFLREVDLWCSVSHRYVLPCLGMCKFDSDIYVVSPFIDNGDLHSCMTKGISFNRSKILYEVAEALAHLHHRGIVHGDVKAMNVLLADDGSALLCDFGLAKALDSMVTSTELKGTGSARWMAPEMFKNASRSMATDVYSFGIIIAEILSGNAPYPDIADNLAVMFHVVFDGGRPSKSPLESPQGKSYSVLWEAAEKCWAKEPENRPNMGQVLGMLFSLAREKD